MAKPVAGRGRGAPTHHSGCLRLYWHGWGSLAAAALGAGYGSGRREAPMLRELVLAIGIPLLVLLLAVLALEQWGDRLPAWLQR